MVSGTHHRFGTARRDRDIVMPSRKPWYAGEHQDALFYLLIAIFFIELIVGGVAFFYGIIHAAPETPGGPPLARFPWLAWSLAAVLAPVGLLLIVHLAGSWLSRAMTRDEEMEVPEAQSSGVAADAHLPEGMKRFYASVRHAPTLVLLLGILLIGVALFFVEGALSALIEIGKALVPYVPWIAGSLAGLLGVCFLAHAFMVYRQRKMENEYAWRREVLEKTGLVLVDKSSVALPQDSAQAALVAPDLHGLPPGEVFDVTAESGALPPGSGGDNSQISGVASDRDSGSATSDSANDKL